MANDTKRSDNMDSETKHEMPNEGDQSSQSGARQSQGGSQGNKGGQSSSQSSQSGSGDQGFSAMKEQSFDEEVSGITSEGGQTSYGGGTSQGK